MRLTSREREDYIFREKLGFQLGGVLVCLFGLIAFCQGCALPGYDASTNTAPNALQKKAILEAVDAYLTSQNCAAALDKILPVYDSESSDNDIRLATATAYGCSARVNFLKILSDLLAFSGDLAGSGFWEFLAQEFPSTATPDDKVPQAAINAIDAVMSALVPGTILLPAYTLYHSSHNPASLLVADRISDANSFLTFLGMSLMGSLLNRYGLPLPNYHKSQNLPWTTAATVTEDGCALAAGLLNFNDGLSAVVSSMPSNLSSKFSLIQTLLDATVTTGCTITCQLAGCAPAQCTGCPTTLRNHASCTFVATDENSCAAAGIALAISNSWTGPP